MGIRFEFGKKSLNNSGMFNKRLMGTPVTQEALPVDKKPHTSVGASRRV